MQTILDNVSLIVGFIGLLFSVVSLTIYYVKRFKAIKTASTKEEKQAIIDEIKSTTYGLVTYAEKVFSDIPKSGSSKLLYVLNHVKDICAVNNTEYDENYWRDFIDNIVATSNQAQEQKALSSEKENIINAIKKKIPTYKIGADQLFSNIPDNVQYKIEYIMKYIEFECEQAEINVLMDFDWETFVKSLYYPLEEVSA